MIWNDKRYHTLDYEMKKVFGTKIIKLSLDGGFTCPNRDGTVGSRGCIFCNEQGAGDFAGRRSQTIQQQIAVQKEFLAKKWPTGKYIAYFQNFTNTYAPVNQLRKLYDEALAADDMVGLAIATRPDCLADDVLDLLGEYAQRTYLWVELGLQTTNASTADLIRRGYELECFADALKRVQQRHIRVVVHVIFGLPQETQADMLASIEYLAKLRIWGVKLHLLHVLRDTDLYQHYCSQPFELFTQSQYVNLVCDALELLPAKTVIHRLTGDGNRKQLVAPKWSLAKLRVLSDIDHELKRRGSYQGCRYEGLTIDNDII